MILLGGGGLRSSFFKVTKNTFQHPFNHAQVAVVIKRVVISMDFLFSLKISKKPELGWFKPSIPVHSFDMAVYFLLAIRDD
ncbi:hypothetical protein NC651_031141 [Populus alba x Populus x berolinensis]|nr:hypothetical protein NC651_031141 [Populus alba x Populus x berolinensis]